jgi:hypothetical protein
MTGGEEFRFHGRILGKFEVVATDNDVEAVAAPVRAVPTCHFTTQSLNMGRRVDRKDLGCGGLVVE